MQAELIGGQTGAGRSAAVESPSAKTFPPKFSKSGYLRMAQRLPSSVSRKPCDSNTIYNAFIGDYRRFNHVTIQIHSASLKDALMRSKRRISNDNLTKEVEKCQTE